MSINDIIPQPLAYGKISREETEARRLADALLRALGRMLDELPMRTIDQTSKLFARGFDLAAADVQRLLQMQMERQLQKTLAAQQAVAAQQARDAQRYARAMQQAREAQKTRAGWFARSG